MADQEPEARALLLALPQECLVVPDAVVRWQQRPLVARRVPPAADLGDRLGDALVVPASVGLHLVGTSVFEQVGKAELLTNDGLALPAVFVGLLRASTADVLTAWDPTGRWHTDDATLHLFEASAADDAEQVVARVPQADPRVLLLHTRFEAAHRLPCSVAHAVQIEIQNRDFEVPTWPQHSLALEDARLVRFIVCGSRKAEDDCGKETLREGERSGDASVSDVPMV